MSFVDDIVLYIENPKYPTRKMWEIKNKFTKVTGYKINIQKAVTLLYINNELSETELRKQSFTIQFSSDAQLCPTLYNAMDCSTPASLSTTNSQSLLKLMSNESVMPSNNSSSVVPFPSGLQSFLASESILMNQFFTSGGQSIGASASASVLLMNIQDWFPLEWTGWISLLSKGLSRVFSNTTVQKHQFFGVQISL